jgi:hypothetical protein
MTARRVLVSPRDFALQSGQGAACSRLVAMSARHLMIHNGRKRLPVGLSVDEQFQAGNARQNSLPHPQTLLTQSRVAPLSTPQNPAGSPKFVTRSATSNPVFNDIQLATRLHHLRSLPGWTPCSAAQRRYADLATADP